MPLVYLALALVCLVLLVELPVVRNGLDKINNLGTVFFGTSVLLSYYTFHHNQRLKNVEKSMESWVSIYNLLNAQRASASRMVESLVPQWLRDLAETGDDPVASLHLAESIFEGWDRHVLGAPFNIVDEQHWAASFLPLACSAPLKRFWGALRSAYGQRTQVYGDLLFSYAQSTSTPPKSAAEVTELAFRFAKDPAVRKVFS